MFKLSGRAPSPGRRKDTAAPALGTSIALGFILSSGALLMPLQAHAGNNLVVRTAEGPVQGFVQSGVIEFLGIPYAAPPVGNLRWMPPVKHASWTKTLKATVFGPTCAQTSNTPFSGPPNTNEDCLYINVFTPKVPTNGKGSSEKLPVMFWSYGGGDSGGESNDYDGSKLALQGRTVVVTFNYRVNIFGFLSHPALDREGHFFSNYGILDNQFALRWVHNNIAAFGGDPNNVTIFGQSAGSTNSSAEVLSPLAKGLFERAIFESGAMPALTPLSIAESKGVAFAVAAGCGSGSTPAVAKCLRTLPAAKVQSLAQYAANTTADGQILPTIAIKAYETGHFNHVPIMIGNVENEGIFFIAGTEYSESPQAPLTEAQEQAYVTNTYGGNAGPGGSPPAYPSGTIATVNTHYPLGSAYPTPELQWAATETDGAGPNASICKSRHIDHILANQVPLYTYEFRDQTAPDYWPPMPGFVTLAYHTGDIQYYWPQFHGGPLGIPQALNARQQRLAAQLTAAWTNFAWTGNPNGQGNSPWPRFTNKNSLYLAEDTNGLRTETDAALSAEHQCAFWDNIIVYAPAP